MTTTVASLQAVLGADTSGFTNALRGVESALGRFGSNLTNRMQALGTSISDVGRSMTVITAPLLAFGATGLQAASGFEQVMVQLQTFGGLAADELEAVRQAALQMGAATMFSASDAANAMLELVKAGQSVDQAMISTQAALDLAAVGSMSMAEAAGVVSTAMAQFGLGADQASDIVEVLAAAASSSRADVADLAAGFANVGPVAAQMGLSLEDTAAALAVFSNAGIGGAEAGTQLRSMLLNLNRPTESVRDAMAELGISLYDSQGNFIGLNNFIQMLNASLDQTRTIIPDISAVQATLTDAQAAYNDALRDAWQAQERLNRAMAGGDALAISYAQEALEGANQALAEATSELVGAQSALDNFDNSIQTYNLTQQRQNELLQVLGGSYGIVGLQALLAAGGVETMQTAMGTAPGAAELAAASMGTFAGRVESLRGSIETLQIEALTPLMDEALGTFVVRVTEAVNGVTTWAQENPELAGTLVQLLAGVAVLGPAMFILGQGITAVTTVMGALGTVAGVIFSPIGLLIGSIVALGVVASNTFGGFDRLLSAAATGAQNLVFGLRDALFAALEGAANTLNTIATGIVGVLTGILTQASGAAQAIVDGVRGIIETGFTALVEAIRPIWDGFVGVLTGIWEAVRPGIEALRTGIETVFGAIRAIVEGVAGAIQSVIDSFNQAGGLAAGNVTAPGAVAPGAIPSMMSAGFQHGGYTGFGPANEVAGIVHRGEYVIPRGGALVAQGGGRAPINLTAYGTSPHELLQMVRRVQGYSE